MVIFPDRCTNRCERHARPGSRLSVTCRVFFGMLLLLLVSSTGCDRAPAPAAESGPKRSSDEARLVRLQPEEVTRSGVTVEPVERTAFRTNRTFPGVIRPNEHALANITTLVRGRVAEVHAELGQAVTPNQLLAVLHSSELGLAQSAYLKARARRHVAEQSYQRAQFLFKEKVIGQAEAQRREGEMISIRAEAQEAREGLRLLGMDDKEIRTLERTQTIRSHVPIVAPFAGRVSVACAPSTPPAGAISRRSGWWAMYRKKISPTCTARPPFRISRSRSMSLRILTKCSRGLSRMSATS